MSEQLFVLDGHNLIYRAYHAMSQADLRDSSGQPTGAVFGLLRMLLAMLEEYQPDYMVAALDSEEPTFRHEFYEEYKEERPEMPDDLRAQIPQIRKLFEVLNIPTLIEPGFECDDLIATLVEEYSSHSYLEIVIVSNDKDNFQLVNGGVRILKQKQGLSDVEMLDSGGVEEELGVPLRQVPD
ncbi:MAG: DNA polymerase I, partial [bacterium]